MHTVRNRVASRPRPPRSSTKGKVPRSAALVAPTRREPAFLLRHPNPPAFPEHLILPAPRGAVIASVPWPERPVTPKAPARKKRGKNDKGKTLKGKLEAKQCRPSPPRKATRRKAADARKPASQEAELPMAARPPAAMPSAPNVQPGSDATVAMTMIDLLDRALAMEPELPSAPTESPSAKASATMAEVTPLPRSHTPMLPRGSGLFETIAQWFRSLALWRSTRARKAQDRNHAVRANARHRALQSHSEALEALQSQTKG